MRTRIQAIWDHLRSSYWFIPAVMAFFAIVLALSARELDQRYPDTIESILPESAIAGPDGAREMLSAIAGSTITVAGVTFSILIVALSNASSQFGPRILRIFMQDTGSQVVLGTFTSIFLYCLIILRTVRGTEGSQFVPHLSVTIGLIMALAGIGVLIYFLHHSAGLIHVSNIAARIGKELQHAIVTVYPEQIGTTAGDVIDVEAIEQPPADVKLLPPASEATEVLGSTSGYIQAIDQDGILETAQELDIVIRILKRPGSFVVPGIVLAHVTPAENIEDGMRESIAEAFIVGAQRTAIQEVELFFDELIEIALRALSPSVNDPYTAITVIDWIAGGFSVMVERSEPSPYRYDQQGNLRVIAEPVTFIELVDRVFDQLRSVAGPHSLVLNRLLDMIVTIGPLISTADQRNVFLRQAGLIAEAARDQESFAPHVKDALRERHREAVHALSFPQTSDRENPD